ncbi:MAG: phosphatidate cytidylyltransferase [Streptosporangiaceae bacterium]
MDVDEPRGPRGGSPGGGRSRSPGRAGRNLPVAIGVGVGLGALVVAALYTIKLAFVALAIVAVGLAVWELARALGAGGARVPLIPVLVGAVAMLVGAYERGAGALVVIVALTAVAVFVWRLPEGADGYVRDVSAGVFASVYVPFLAGFVMMLLSPHDGPDRVMTFVGVTTCSDIGGYFVGVLVGRHPLAPTISPKKTWEGLAGSAAASVACGIGLVWWLLHGDLWEGAVLGGAVVCAATLGDLGESMMKRDLGIKDMGSLLPGHGGVMERLDSILLGAPVAWIVLTALVPPPS